MIVNNLKKGRIIINSKIWSGIGFTIIFIWLYKVLVDQYSWVDSNQIAFHLPLLALWWGIFRHRLNVFILGILCVLSYLIADNGIIDEIIFQWFQDRKLFPESMAHGGFTNPQYMKLILYFVTLPIMGCLLIFKKKRSPERVFIFLSAISCLLVTYLIHVTIPAVTLSWERKMVNETMTSVLLHLTQNPDLDPISVCGPFQYKCHRGIDERLLEASYGIDNKNLILKQTQTGAFSSFESGQFNQNGRWNRLVIGILRKQGESYVLVEEKNINKSQLISEEAFGKLGTFACLIWGLVMLGLGIFHTSPFRKKLFAYDAA